MLLQRLREYAIRQDLPPVGCARVFIRYAIHLDTQGHLEQITDLVSSEHKRGELLVCPDYGSRTSGNFAIPFADHAQYTLGISIPKKNPASTPARHELYKSLIYTCADATKEPSVQAVAAFLKTCRFEEFPLPEDFDPEAKITFVVDGVYPAALASVQRWWAARMSTADPERWLECLVCGTMCHPLTILPTQIHGIPGGQPTGMALISGQMEAAESYGLERTHYAPLCEQCGHQVTIALNTLLRQADTHTRIGDTVYVYWTDEKHAPVSEIMDAKPNEVDALLSSPWRGDLTSPEKYFWMAALKANAARVVVSDWIDTTLDHVYDHIQRYFRLQRIVDKTGAYRSFPLWQLAEAAGERSETALLRCALRGDPLPLAMVHHVIRRPDISIVQAALLKMILLSQQEAKNMPEELDEKRTDPAYLCGRIFTCLESIEWKAQGAISHSMKNYYAAASRRPAAVFAILLQRAGWHLKKMQKDPEKRGAYIGLNRQLQGLLALLDNFPSAISLAEQATFALGYYHQKTANQQAAAQAVLAKQEKEESETNP